MGSLKFFPYEKFCDNLIGLERKWKLEFPIDSPTAKIYAIKPREENWNVTVTKAAFMMHPEKWDMCCRFECVAENDFGKDTLFQVMIPKFEIEMAGLTPGEVIISGIKEKLMEVTGGKESI